MENVGDLPIVLFLNPGCLLEGDAVDALLNTLWSDEKFGIFGGLLLNSDGSEQAGGRRAVPTPWRSFVRGLWPGAVRKSLAWHI
jgi:GT2 family glycosyltransferase